MSAVTKYCYSPATRREPGKGVPEDRQAAMGGRRINTPALTYGLLEVQLQGCPPRVGATNRQRSKREAAQGAQRPTLNAHDAEVQ